MTITQLFELHQEAAKKPRAKRGSKKAHNRYEKPSEAVAVVRKSTDSEDLQKNSLEMQKKSILEFAKNNNIEIIKFFEESQSGTVDLHECGAIVNALVYCKQNKISTIIFDENDRASRSTKRWNLLSNICETEGIQILFAKSGMETDSEFAQLKNLLSAIVAEKTVKLMKTRISEGMKNVKSKGLKYAKEAELGTKFVDNKIVEDERELEVIRIAIELRNNGLSYSKVAEKINGLGHLNRNNKPYQAMSIYNMVKKFKNK